MELKLKDFVDEESLDRLKELDATIGRVRQTYRDAASELIKGLDIEVRVKGDVDRIQAKYNTQRRMSLRPRMPLQRLSKNRRKSPNS